MKVTGLEAGMVARADSIADLGLLRHGSMRRLFTARRAPTTLGAHLRAYTFRHVRQLNAVAARLLTSLTRQVPGLLTGAGKSAFLDVDDTICHTHGYAKQGTGYGYSVVRGLNAQLATLSTSTAAPVIVSMRLRRGSGASAHGAPRLIAEALATEKRAGAIGAITVRADSAYCNRDVIAAANTAWARFSVTARMDPAVTAAISRISADAWTAIQYPNAIFDKDEVRWISDADVAEICYTAFTSRRKAEHVSARWIVRWVRLLNPASARNGQDELQAAHRHHAVFTDSSLSMLEAEVSHRDHAIVEQVIADLKAGPLAHLPSGVSPPARDDRSAGQSAKTQPTGTRTPIGSQKPAPSYPPPMWARPPDGPLPTQITSKAGIKQQAKKSPLRKGQMLMTRPLLSV